MERRISKKFFADNMKTDRLVAYKTDRWTLEFLGYQIPVTSYPLVIVFEISTPAFQFQ